jgi:C-terminal processing protease CtpA/Prc
MAAGALLLMSLSAGSVLAEVTAIAHPVRPTASLATPDLTLEAAYKSAWATLDRGYANHDKLPSDWLDWKDKYTGKLHSEKDLTEAFIALTAHINDPEVRVLTPAQLAAVNAADAGGHLGYGLSSKILPVLGPIAQLHVTEHVYQACSGENCWSGEGQGHKDGLRDGDILYAVDGKSFEGMDTWQLFDYVVTHNGPVLFSVKRGDQFLDVTVHPQPNRPMNFNLDIDVREIGNFGKAFVFADAQGPAMQAGIAEKDELLSVNGKPVEQLTDADLRALKGECKLGDSLRLKIARLPNEVTIPCGLVPLDDKNMSGNAGGISNAAGVPWQVSIRNLDDPRLSSWVERFLADYTHGANVFATIDLRGAGGNDDRAMEKLVSMFVQNAPLACLTAGWRTDTLCDAVTNGSVIDYGKRVVSEPSAPFHGQIAVVIDDDTRGTALVLAAILQQNGGLVITSGAGVRQLPDIISKESLLGDPAARWIQYPGFHYRLANGASTFTADKVVPKGEEFNTIGQAFKLSSAPYDLREYD